LALLVRAKREDKSADMSGEVLVRAKRDDGMQKL